MDVFFPTSILLVDIAGTRSTSQAVDNCHQVHSVTIALSLVAVATALERVEEAMMESYERGDENGYLNGYL